MDKSIVDVDQESNMNEKYLETSSSKCSSSLIQINSIAIDINCPPEEEIESPKHEHFSIRGFVSETKRKDKKKCMPFASEADDDDDDDNNINLPPISAPEFRRWQYSKRVPDIANQKNTIGMILVDKSDAGRSSEKHTGEKHNFLTHSIQNIGGDEHGSRGPKDVDYNHPNENLLGFNPQCTKGHRDVVNNIEHACVTQIETHSNNTPADEPENVSFGSDEFAFRALPHKRKPKLRSLAEIINEDKSLTTEQNPKTKSLQIEVDLNNPFQEMEEDSSEIDKTDPPIVTAKRSKGPVTEAEKLINNNSKRVKILETESERDNRPTLLDSRVSAKAQQKNKARKYKSIDLNRKPRRDGNENRKTVATNETGFGEKGNVGSCFKNCLFGRQMETVSALLKGKRHAEGENITGIPDLNEAYIEKPSMTVPTVQVNMDISALSRRETVREGKRPVESIDNNAVGASDDIPMEIVELLAKNQHERALDNSRKHRIPESIHNSFRGSPYAERSGLSSNFRPVQGFVNSSPMTNSNKSHFGRFSPLPPGQHRIPPYSGLKPTTSGPRSRLSEGSDLLWPPRRKSVTFDLNVALNPSIQSNKSEDQSEKTKNAKNAKLGEGNGAANEGCSIKSGKIGPGRYKSVPSKDAYSNETSPTMQLLPLMEQGKVLGSSFKLGPNNFLDRQKAPCHHQQSGRSKDFPTLMLNGVGYSVDGSKQSSSKAAQMPRPQAINSAGPSSRATQPSSSYPSLEVCTLNWNPADFNIPEAKNECSNSAKRNSSKDKSEADGNVEGSKRQRVEKDLSRKESSRK